MLLHNVLLLARWDRPTADMEHNEALGRGIVGDVTQNALRHTGFEKVFSWSYELASDKFWDAANTLRRCRRLLQTHTYLQGWINQRAYRASARDVAVINIVLIWIWWYDTMRRNRYMLGLSHSCQ